MSDFDKFCDRQVPPILRDGPAPESWEDAPYAWDEIRTLAREQWRSQKALEFVELIARGWRSSELATGSLAPGAQLSNGGQVVRLRSETAPYLQQRARALLGDLAREPRRAGVDELLLVSIEEMATGSYSSRSGEAILSEAEGILAAYRARLAQEQAKVDSAITIDVAVPFRGPSGREFAAGRQRVTPELLAELGAWAERMEAQRDQRAWEWPLGFERRWPAYRPVSANVGASAP